MSATIEKLPIFVAVAEAHSFSGAAERLGLPKSSVSRAIAALEAEVGAQLFHRTTRQVALTSAGAALYEETAPLLARLQQAVGNVPEEQEEPTGELRLTAPNDVGVVLLGEVLPRFTARYPAVRCDVVLTNRVIDLVRDRFDVALRASSGPLADSSLLARKLSPIELQLFASPAYLAHRGTPRSLEDLREHDFVQFRDLGLGRTRISGDDYFFVREAIRGGAGVGPLPTFLARDDVTSGRLVRVLRWSETRGAFWMVHPETKRASRKLVAFREFLVDWLSSHPL